MKTEKTIKRQHKPLLLLLLLFEIDCDGRLLITVFGFGNCFVLWIIKIKLLKRNKTRLKVSYIVDVEVDCDDDATTAGVETEIYNLFN